MENVISNGGEKSFPWRRKISPCGRNDKRAVEITRVAVKMTGGAVEMTGMCSGKTGERRNNWQDHGWAGYFFPASLLIILNVSS